MSTVYIEFTDGTHEKVGSVFSSPQNATGHPDYAEIDSDDERYIEFMKTVTNNPFNVQSPVHQAN